MTDKVLNKDNKLLKECFISLNNQDSKFLKDKKKIEDCVSICSNAIFHTITDNESLDKEFIQNCQKLIRISKTFEDALLEKHDYVDRDVFGLENKSRNI